MRLYTGGSRGGANEHCPTLSTKMAVGAKFKVIELDPCPGDANCPVFSLTTTNMNTVEKLTTSEILLIQYILSEIVEKAKPATSHQLLEVNHLFLINDQVESLKRAIIKMQ
jgi:hypothetical protein